MTNLSHSNEIFSCKLISDGTIKSDTVYGYALYGESELGRSRIAKQKPQILIFNNQEMITFKGEEYSLLASTGWDNKYYWKSYEGLIEVYGKKENEVTLFTSISNGYNSQKSTFIKVKLWHCNK